MVTTIVKTTSQPITYIIHGIGSSQKQLTDITSSLKENGVLIYNLGLTGDPLTSIFTFMDKQCSLYNEEIIGTLKGGNNTLPLINIIGISQGGLIARCLVERYNDLSYSVKNIITISSPNMGVYYVNNTQPKWIQNMEAITFNEYWKDPFTYEKYLDSKKFLAKLNNEVNHSEYDRFQYNFMNINKFVAIWSNIDEVIQPRESAKFDYWNIEKAEKYGTLELENVSDTDWYNNDNLGYKYLVKNEAYVELMYPCNHEEFKLPVCYNNSSLSSNSKTLLDTLVEYCM
jgi:triacylglycerol esterase/lipase EstA (alpha/beta hydrolase family)